MNSPQDEDGKLASLLRQNATEISDNGFSARVLASLPAKHGRSKTPSIAILLSGIGGVVGLLVALARGATLKGFGETFAQNFANDGVPIASPELIIAVALAAFCLFFSYLLTKYSSELF